jgi:hypothetical protein
MPTPDENEDGLESKEAQATRERMEKLGLTGTEAESVAARRKVEADQVKARAQAAKDALITKGDVPLDDLKPGHTPTLAQLNAIAERNNTTTNDTIHKTAVAVARVTKDVMKGVGVGSEQHKRAAKAAGAERKLSAAQTDAEKRAELKSTDVVNKGKDV